MSNIDHEQLAISRLATQFKESTNLIAYITALLKEANTLEAVFCSIIEDRTISNATGATLDIIGEIVGQPRELVDATLFSYFGFAPNLVAESFGTVTDPGVGGRFRELNEPSSGVRVLTDTEYRLFILNKITTNYTIPTPENVISILKMVLNNPMVTITETGNASYTVEFDRVLTLNEKALLLQTDLIPKPAGVKVTYIFL